MKDLKINEIKDLKNEGKSFYWASFFLPKENKKNAGILYSICRHFDNIADKDDRNMSEYLKESIKDIKNNEDNIVNIFFKTNNIDILILEDLFNGLVKDQFEIKIKNEQELIKYSYFVAGTVGLMMSKIIGVKNPISNSSAIDLGIAMQMTNIARDVYEDSQINRVYLPSEWLNELSISSIKNDSNLSLDQEKIISKAVHRLINLSQKFYNNGFAGLKYVPFTTRLGIFIAANIYRGIGIKIKKRGNIFIRERIYLNFLEKFFITLKSIFIFIFLPLLNYKYLKVRDLLPNESL